VYNLDYRLGSGTDYKGPKKEKVVVAEDGTKTTKSIEWFATLVSPPFLCCFRYALYPFQHSVLHDCLRYLFPAFRFHQWFQYAVAIQCDFVSTEPSCST
jgi:hypothetical protein